MKLASLQQIFIFGILLVFFASHTALADEGTLILHQDDGTIEYQKGSTIVNITLEVNLFGATRNVNNSLFAFRHDANRFKFGYSQPFSLQYSPINRSITTNYRIVSNDPIRKVGHALFFTDTYLNFADVCGERIDLRCSPALQANGTRVACTQEPVFVPTCAFTKVSDNEYLLTFFSWYFAATNSLLIDPIIGVTNGETHLRDDFSNTTAGSLAAFSPSIEYGFSGWDTESGSGCSYSGNGEAVCSGAGENGVKAQPYEVNNNITFTCKYDCNLTDVSVGGGGGCILNMVNRSGLIQDKCSTGFSLGNIRFPNVTESINLLGILNNVQYTVFITYNATFNTCDYYGFQTGNETEVNASANDVLASTSNGLDIIDGLILKNNIGTTTSTYDYVYCYNGTRFDDPSTTFTNIVEYPSNGSAYNYSEANFFNVTITDVVDDVWIVFNSTNYSLSADTVVKDGSVYIFNSTAGSAVATYDYQWWMNTSDGSVQSSSSQSYTIIKNNATATLLIEGQGQNFSSKSNQNINVTIDYFGESFIVQRNEDTINTGGIEQVSVTNTSAYNLAGAINITVFHDDTENFTSNFSWLFINVIDFITDDVDPDEIEILDTNFVLSFEVNNSATSTNITRLEANLILPNGTYFFTNETAQCIVLSEANHQLCNYTITHPKQIGGVGNWTYDNVTVWKDSGENFSELDDTNFTVYLPFTSDVYEPLDGSTQSSLSFNLNFTVAKGDFCTPITCLSSCYYNVTRGASQEIAHTELLCNNLTTITVSSDNTNYVLNTFFNDTNGNENYTSTNFTVTVSGGQPGGQGQPGGGGGGTIQVGTGGSTGNCDVDLTNKITLTPSNSLGLLEIKNNQLQAISTLISIEPPTGILEPDGKEYISFPSADLTPILPGQTLPISIQLNTVLLVQNNVTENLFARLKVPGENCEDFVPVEIDVGEGLNIRRLFRLSFQGLFAFPSSLAIIGGMILSIYIINRRKDLKTMSLIKKTGFVLVVGFLISFIFLIFLNLLAV